MILCLLDNERAQSLHSLISWQSQQVQIYCCCRVLWSMSRFLVFTLVCHSLLLGKDQSDGGVLLRVLQLPGDLDVELPELGQVDHHGGVKGIDGHHHQRLSDSVIICMEVMFAQFPAAKLGSHHCHQEGDLGQATCSLLLLQQRVFNFMLFYPSLFINNIDLLKKVQKNPIKLVI